MGRMDMKFFSLRSVMTLFVLILSYVTVSCDRLGQDSVPVEGVLCISFDDESAGLTRSRLSLPDTCDFHLSIKDSDGNSIYDGLYGDCPETLNVSSGSYMVKAVSGVVSLPSFDAPQFGDEQYVLVPSGGKAKVRLLCRQLNAGIRIDFSKDFLSECPDAVMFLKSASGKLMYSYMEKRFAYFPAGQVSLMMSVGGDDRILMQRDLNESEMLTVRISVSSKKDDSALMRMDLDTARVWLQDEILIGASDDTGSEVLSVSDAKSMAEKEDVWVSGYVVGGDLTSASASFDSPFSSRTCLLLGPKSSTRNRDECISVQLSAGDVRNVLNLVDNPQMHMRRVCLRGDLVSSYYGLVGLKNITEYQIIN